MTRPPDTFDDRAMLERLRSGDKAACDECIAHYAPFVRRVALRLTGDEAEAEDVVQETLLQAFRGIERFDGRSAIGTWLYRIAHNTAMMRRRRVVPEQVSVDESGGLEGHVLVPKALFDWCCLPEPELDQAEIRSQLASAIEAMPDKLRAVFLLREVDGRTTRATAELLGVSEAVVKTRLRRSRLWLRERLATYFSLAGPEVGIPPER